MRTLLAMMAAAAVLAVGGFQPATPSEVGKLVPVQTLCVTCGAAWEVTADGGLSGRGDSFDAALEDLSAGAPGQLFLGTVSAVTLTDETEIREILDSDALRPAVQVLRLHGSAAPDELTTFLAAHSGGVTIAALRTARAQDGTLSLPALIQTKEGFRIGTDH